MGFIGDMFTSDQGSAWRPAGANILNPITAQQGTDTVGQANAALQQQQALINSLQGAANGQGPSAAQAQMQQGTDQAVKQAAATIASSRGINPGTAARLAGQQQAATAQGAVNNASALRAQEQQAARGELGSAISGLTGSTLQEQSNLLNQISNQNNANVSMVSNENNARAGIVAGNQKSQSGLLGGITGGISGGGTLLSAKGGVVPNVVPNYDDGGMVDSAPTAAAPPTTPSPALVGAPGPQSFAGRFMNNLVGTPASGSTPAVSGSYSPGKALKAAIKGTIQAAIKGNGSAPKAPAIEETAMPTPGVGEGPGAAIATADFDEGGEVEVSSPSVSDSGPAKPEEEKKGGIGSLVGSLAALLAQGGKVPAMVSPGEKYLSPQKAKEVAQSSNKAEAIKQKAEVIPGKAKVKGDSLKNDIVPKTLESGGVVIPRTKAQDPKKAADFVAAVMGHKGLQAKRKAKKK